MSQAIPVPRAIRRAHPVWCPAVAAVLVLTQACAPPQPVRVGTPVADPDSLEASITSATSPDSPRQATFSWRLDEAGSTVRGSGVVRFEAPERMRLDLFGPRGETYLVAALVGDEFRLPPGAAGGFDLPSPSLLWAALGVVRSPADASLDAATLGDGAASLGYVNPGGERHEFRVDFAPGPRLARVERIGRSGVLETVRVEYADDHPARTSYVDRRTFRELILEMESVRDVESFPESIWRPDAPSGGS